MMEFPVPPGDRRHTAVKRPKPDAFTGIIDIWPVGDHDLHHTKCHLFDRLKAEHGFNGGDTTLMDDMRERERRSPEMLEPLTHPPGHAQADFGAAVVAMGGVQQKAHFFVMDLAHGRACCVRAYPAATADALVDGHVQAFGFFGSKRYGLALHREG
jgi:transposase